MARQNPNNHNQGMIYGVLLMGLAVLPACRSQPLTSSPESMNKSFSEALPNSSPAPVATKTPMPTPKPPQPTSSPLPLKG
jgi:hypothetical protein